MEALEAIKKRRSIRQYKEQTVDEETIKKILSAAMSAPSAHNQRPWRFIGLRNRATLNKIASLHPYAQALKTAPLAIIVCGDYHLIRDEDFWPQDCAAATENILLAATALGLGSLWMGVYPKTNLVKTLQEFLDLPQNIVPFSLIALGYAAKEKESKERYDETRFSWHEV